MTQSHTKTPWEVFPNSSVIYGVNDPDRQEKFRVAVAQCGDEISPSGGLKYGKERDANAAFIVQAVNSHDELLEACKAVREYLKDQSSRSVKSWEGSRASSDAKELLPVIESAIARATGGKE